MIYARVFLLALLAVLSAAFQGGRFQRSSLSMALKDYREGESDADARVGSLAGLRAPFRACLAF